MLIIDLDDFFGIVSEESFGVTFINLHQTIYPEGIESGEDFRSILAVYPIAPEYVLGTPNVGYQIQLSGWGISSQEVFGTCSVGNITLRESIYNPRNQFGIPNIVNISSVPLISDLVRNQLPSFVKEDHERFLSFIEAYYEWLEVYRNVQFDISRLLTYQDIDTTLDEFVERFFREFLTNIPRNIIANRSLLLQHIQDFYRAKGTEKSYRFFFRLLFGKECDFYFPRVDIFRLSDGKWLQPRTIRILRGKGNPADLVGRNIRGLTNNATAFVENVQIVQEHYITVYELYLNTSSIAGVFEPNEKIRSRDGTIDGIISPIVTSLEIVSPGFGYEVDQEIEIISEVGHGARAVIKAVSPDGQITSIEMLSFGAGYTEIPMVNPSSPTVIEFAELIPKIGALAKYPGSYLNQDGQLSSTKYLHDGRFYQQFSYVVYVDESLNLYRDALKKMVHPAGLEFFGGYRSVEELDASIKVPLRQESSEVKLILQHFKYLWVVYDNFGKLIDRFSNKEQAINYAIKYGHPVDEIKRYDIRELEYRLHNEPIDARIKAHKTEVYLIQSFKEYENSATLGPTYRSIERDKFFYKPYGRRDVSSDVAGSVNENYWKQFANYQIKDFGDIIIRDMIEKPWTKINIMPELEWRTTDHTGIPSKEQFGHGIVTKTI